MYKREDILGRMSIWKSAAFIGLLVAAILSTINSFPLQQTIGNNDTSLTNGSTPDLWHDNVAQNDYIFFKDSHCKAYANDFPTCEPKIIKNFEDPLKYFDYPSTARLEDHSSINYDIYKKCTSLPTHEFIAEMMKPEVAQRFYDQYSGDYEKKINKKLQPEFFQSDMIRWVDCFKDSLRLFNIEPLDFDVKSGINEGTNDSYNNPSQNPNQHTTQNPTSTAQGGDGTAEDTKLPQPENQDSKKLTEGGERTENGANTPSLENQNPNDLTESGEQFLKDNDITQSENKTPNDLTEDTEQTKIGNQTPTITTEDIDKNGDKTKPPQTEIQEQVATEGKQNENENKSQTNKQELDANKEDGMGIKENQNGADKSNISDDGMNCVDEAEIYDLCACKSSAAQIGQTFMPVAVSTVLLTALGSSSV